MEEIVLFIMSYIFVFIIYQIFIIGRVKHARKENKKKEPIEVTYLVRQYHLDLKQVNYNQLLMVVALVSSFDIALIVSVVSIINSFILQILGGFLFTLIIIYVSYYLVYLFYKKKGMVNDEY